MKSNDLALPGIIEKSCIDGQKTYHVDLEKAMRDYIHANRAEFVPEGVDVAAVEEVAAAEAAEASTPSTPSAFMLARCTVRRNAFRQNRKARRLRVARYTRPSRNIRPSVPVHNAQYPVPD